MSNIFLTREDLGVHGADTPRTGLKLIGQFLDEL